MKELISVIIATYNRGQSLATTLESFLAQDLDGSFDYELILVDNNSQDNTKAVAETFLPRFNGKLHYVFEAQQGKPFALNRGIKESKGSILAFTDDDVVLDPAWLKELIECFRKHDSDGVGGRVLPQYPQGTAAWIKDFPNEMAGVVVICDMGQGNQPFENGRGKLIGANYAFKRATFEKHGLFKTDIVVSNIAIAEDTEFIQRLLAANSKLYYCGRAVVWHPVDLSRLNYRFLAKWHHSLGKIAARNEHLQYGESIARLGGVPIYLYRGILQDLGMLIILCWDRQKSFRYFRGLFRKFGMISEYKSIHQNRREGQNAQG